ncbi:MAG: hypothetical protein HKM04_04835 [Legionellales bacterium]|nr:hypothetical protein [Legionellales bacterium]
MIKLHAHFMMGILVLMAVLITSCSPVSIPNSTTYQLTSVVPPSNASVKKPSNQSLLVSLPQATAGYDTDKMAYILHPYELGYFTKNQWVDEPRRMLEPLIAESLQNTHQFSAVTEAPFSGFTDLRLDTTLLELHQNFLTNPSQVELVVDVRLVKCSSQRIIAGKRFSITVPALQNTPYGGVQAANQAVAIFLQQLIKFIPEASHL